MCCGQKRSALRNAPNSPRAPRQTLAPAATPALATAPAPAPSRNSSVALRYLESSPIRVRGPVTGQPYDFSGSHPVQAVDSRDATALLRTRFFRQG